MFEKEHFPKIGLFVQTGVLNWQSPPYNVAFLKNSNAETGLWKRKLNGLMVFDF